MLSMYEKQQIKKKLLFLKTRKYSEHFLELLSPEIIAIAFSAAAKHPKSEENTSQKQLHEHSLPVESMWRRNLRSHS